MNYPDRYLRQRNYLLDLEPGTSANLAADATFYTVPVPLPAGAQMTVPNVVGLRQTEAGERIRAAQLQARFTGTTDPVVAQTPAPGSKAPPASTVSVELTSSEATVPPVEGLRRSGPRRSYASPGCDGASPAPRTRRRGSSRNRPSAAPRSPLAAASR